ncbi:MBL fold metallo-hydrolase [Lentibacillus sp. N15]|uniref:MBL fold metallo-hydrolase n=1 Tax=Lentibacillus songyuanensis TaxID=3136161 RepID=UPI0031BA3F4B
MKVLQDTIHQLTVPTPFAVGDVHVYLLKGDVLSLVDAGVKTKEAWEALVFQLKELGYSPNDIEQHILTHHHPDHIGLIGEFPRAQSIVGHAFNNPWLMKDETFFKQYEQFFKDYFALFGVPDVYLEHLEKMKSELTLFGDGKITDFIDEGDVLPGHDEWQVIETKGHAQSHLSFFRESDGAFIGGDHLLSHITPNPILEPPHYGEKERPKPLLQYRNNVEKCQQLGIQTVYPGHGEVFHNIEELIPAQRAKQEQRATKVLSMLRMKEQSPFDICQQLFPKQFAKQLDLTMSETIGQLDFLENEGKVQATKRDGILFYQTI